MPDSHARRGANGRPPRRRAPDAIPRVKHALGQHFLLDEALLQSLTDSVGIQPDEGVLEIGPGLGGLTICLARAARAVVALELDETLLPHLRVALENARVRNVTLAQGDALTCDLSALTAPLGAGFRVAANLPYYISTPFFERLLFSGLPMKSLSVMVQREVADKLTATPADAAYGLLSVHAAYKCVARVSHDVPAAAFTPPPKVDSAFVHLTLRDAPPAPVADEKRFLRVARAAFATRRKTLQNCLRAAFPERAADVPDAIARAGLREDVRGEALTVAELIAVANALGNAR